MARASHTSLLNGLDQSRMCFRRKRFGEVISQLFLSIRVDEGDFAVRHAVAYAVIAYVEMFGALRDCHGGGNGNGALIIDVDGRGFLEIRKFVAENVRQNLAEPANFPVTESSGDILRFGGTLSYALLFDAFPINKESKEEDDDAGRRFAVVDVVGVGCVGVDAKACRIMMTGGEGELEVASTF